MSNAALNPFLVPASELVKFAVPPPGSPERAGLLAAAAGRSTDEQELLLELSDATAVGSRARAVRVIVGMACGLTIGVLVCKVM